jgi:hypothetical protein
MRWKKDWVFSILVLVLSIETLVRAVWKKRNKGISGFVTCVGFLCKYLGQLVLISCILSPRAKIFLAAYAWFRRVDDVMDNDALPPKGYSRELYLEQKKNIIFSLQYTNGHSMPLLREDILIVYLLRRSAQYKMDIWDDIVNIWSVMCLDERRRESKTLSTQNELVFQAIRQDHSIIGASIKIFGGNVERFYEIESVLDGVLSRTDWLYDICQDIQNGIIHIPAEAVKKHNINLSRLLVCNSWEELNAVNGFVSWYTEEIETLSRKWVLTRFFLRDNFGGIFTSRLLTFFGQKYVIDEFDDMFKEVSSRVL